MRTFECGSAKELESAIGELSPDSLFRGQVREYLRANGGPSITTSFDRHGCIPERTLKWYHYSNSILAAFVKDFPWEADMAIDQAILQHYGWRSFFVDATKSPTVAAWFAANMHKTSPFMEIVEDCWEEPLFAIKERAWYEAADEIGCVYALSRKALRAASINAVDLVEITTVSGRPRFLAQEAFMVGPVNGPLPDHCVSARLLAPSKAFGEYAATAQHPHSAASLFPHVAEDPVLAGLLAVPWVKRYIPDPLRGMDFFVRGLPLPEYDLTHVKMLGPEITFYRRFWTHDLVGEDERLSDTAFLTAEALFHGGTHGAISLPLVAALVRDKRRVVLEVDGLIAHEASRLSHQFGKGIFLELVEIDLIFLTELLVEHVGTRPRGFGISRGKYFHIDSSGQWQQVAHPEECDCGDEQKHRRHFVVAEHFEAALAEGRFRHVRDGLFADVDVDVTSDPAVIRE